MVDPRQKITMKIIDAGDGFFDVHLYKGPGLVITDLGIYNSQRAKYETVKELLEQYPREKNQAKRLLMLKGAPNIVMIQGTQTVSTKAIVDYLRKTYPLGK